ncbi:MAG: aspartate aminotransferase family protein [Chloroflexi bacterium]|nr:aspartate aminotransferase family protein [Chloroflexota bacterium]|tara:strand:+ start:126 stop:1322 length:1197 start_codon:yes stop_codon:yes gene_type:complete
MDEQNWKDMESKYYMHAANRYPMVIEKGEGTKLWDTNGNEYLDFTSGWAVNNIGHSNQVVADAIEQQSKTLLQTSNVFYTIPQLKLAEILIENSVLDKIFICNSGAEANEGAIKLARKWGKINKNGASKILTAYNSFHGRTISTLAATGQPKYHETFMPVTEGFDYFELNNIDSLKEKIDDETVGIMIEVVQGEGGVNICSQDFINNIRKICDEKNIIMIIDEVQTGIGRLGSFYGYEKFGIEPDVITLAKGLGAGVPIGAILAKDEYSVFVPGDHGSTFGGNALTSAAAYASSKFILENDISNNVNKLNSYFTSKLNELMSKFEIISEVRGMGLLIALEFSMDIAADMITECNKNGLLVNAVRPNALRFMPPLTVTEDEIDQAISKLQKSLENVLSK